MAVSIHAPIKGGGVNWLADSMVTPAADNATDIEVRVSDANGYTPNRHEVALSLKRLAGFLETQEGGEWPLVP